MNRIGLLLAATLVALQSAACAPKGATPASPAAAAARSTGADSGASPGAAGGGAVAPGASAALLAAAESVYADLRALRDRYDVTIATGRDVSPEGIPLPALARGQNALRDTLATRLRAVDSTALATEDRKALAIMGAALARDLGPLSGSPADRSGAAASPPDCGYDAAAIGALRNGPDSLSRRAYACYAWAQHNVVADGEALDRLTLLARLARTDDRERRRSLFLALDPVWRSMNGDDRPASPYRQLVRAVARRGGPSPVAIRARALGVEPDTMLAWLVAILEAWRAAAPDSLIEPWDWHYQAGKASRVLSPRVPAESLRAINAAVFRALGADVDSLHVRYDLAPREGKTPVAFTTFGVRARHRGDGWQPAEPWVFATYRTGGLDNLNELLHETGHAVHIAAVRTRPAFADWPDSDPFTEAVADLIALDVYEPAWQQRWLGDSVPL
ncbi:MAG TPA: hypothetical protein VFK09_02065, partial [Gemmatimonadales bacterium]|nr:hypothetical protein [Gemmatimonadales bacterium]